MTRLADDLALTLKISLLEAEKTPLTRANDFFSGEAWKSKQELRQHIEEAHDARISSVNKTIANAAEAIIKSGTR